MTNKQLHLLKSWNIFKFIDQITFYVLVQWPKIIFLYLDFVSVKCLINKVTEKKFSFSDHAQFNPKGLFIQLGQV